MYSSKLVSLALPLTFTQVYYLQERHTNVVLPGDQFKGRLLPRQEILG